MPPNTTPKLRIRGMILTAGIAAITIMGTMFGAGLKAERETTERRTKVTEPGSEDELIAALETRRRGLVQAKLSWEKKAQSLRERIERNGQSRIDGGSAGSGNSSVPSGK